MELFWKIFGGQDRKVGEPPGSLKDAVVVAEFEAYPDPKTLTAAELAALKRELRTNRRVAEAVGGKQGRVRDTLALMNPEGNSRKKMLKLLNLATYGILVLGWASAEAIAWIWW